jgi:hypothetical protein
MIQAGRAERVKIPPTASFVLFPCSSGDLNGNLVSEIATREQSLRYAAIKSTQAAFDVEHCPHRMRS